MFVLLFADSVESPTRVVELVTPASHLPPFTVADVIVTPDPFRDVIRTEPAPDLSSLISEIMPIEGFPATAAPAVSQNDTHPSLSTTKFISSTTASSVTTVDSLSTLLYKNKTKKTPTDEYDYKEIKDDENTDDEFSFDSVFSYLFDSEKWTTTFTTEAPHSTIPSDTTKSNITQLMDEKVTNKSSGNILNSSKLHQETIEHRSDEDVNELSNLLNSTSERDKLQNQGDKNMSLDMESTTKTNYIVTLKSPNKIVHPTTVRTKFSTKRFGEKNPSIYSRPFFTKPTPATVSVADPGVATGILKLAGCNIYGRMYRVGRIISELSSPCLECMCTEVGVQCRPLKC